MSVCRHRPLSKLDVELVAVSRLEALLNALQKFYGALPPPPRDPFTLFVWEVLSVHSTPRKRDAALAALKRIPRADAGRDVARAAEEARGERHSSPVRTSRTGCRRCAPASSCFAARRICRRSIRGPLPAARRALKPFPQLGETGAHRMLLFAADQVILPVDARVSRVGAAARLRRGGRRFQEAGAIGPGRAGRASCRRRPTPTAARSSTCRTTAAPPARRATRTARSVRC